MSGESIKESLETAMHDYDDTADVSVSSVDSDFEPADDISDEADGYKSASKESKSSPGRDASGRFVKGSEHLQAKVDEDTTTLAEEFKEEGSADQSVDNESPEKEIPPAPSGFGKHQELWQKLNDPNSVFGNEDKKQVLDFYKSRESEMLRGMGQYRDIAEKSQYLHKAIEGFVPQLLQEGIDPATLVSNLAKAHFTLTNGTPQQKIETFNYLMQSYGVSFDHQQGQITQTDPHVQQMMDSVRGVESRLASFEQERLQKESIVIQSEIQAIANNRTDFPLFNEARDGMVRLLESRQVETFEEAYRLAVRLDDGLWSKHSARQLPPASQKQAHIQKARRAGVSVSNQAPAAKPISNGAYKAPVVRSKTNRQSILDSLRTAMADS